MKKNGFTLIELLAVIVILAIIALIATPIILNIIRDARESANERSRELYATAVKTAIMKKKIEDPQVEIKGSYTQTNAGRTLTSASGDVVLTVEYDGDVQCDVIEVLDNYELKLDGCKVEGVDSNYNGEVTSPSLPGGSDNPTGGQEETKTLDTICTYEYDSTNGIAEKTAGAKYKCKVKEQMETKYKDGYTFYVLTTPKSGDTTINLIMDQNINSDGTPAGMTAVTQGTNASQYNLVAWNNESGQSTNAYGPVTAMQFLYNATKDWTNIDPVNYTYNDKTTQGTTAENTSYTSFVSSNGVATITPVTGDGVTIGREAAPLRARMPIYASDTTITEVTSKTNASYLYDNLDPNRSYWTLSSIAEYSGVAWYVGYHGRVDGTYVDDGGTLGVRAVITLKI